jgi:hydroxymethylpyrimidine/phosphomethylpyrimidine kinase
MAETPPRLLTIAGSDSGGGAGVQADLKTFAAHGAYGMSVVTALTAQNTQGVRAVHLATPAIVAAQIDAVFEDIGVDAVKIGMLASAEIIEAVADRLQRWRGPPIVLDPVMVAKSGDTLLQPDAVEALLRQMLPLAALITPNLGECEALSEMPVSTLEQRQAAARRLATLGPAVLVKGGHDKGSELIDVLYDGHVFHTFKHRRQKTTSTHGTGCTLSSAIACRLARSDDMATAVGAAIEYLQRAMAAAYPLGGGHGPVNHLYALRGSNDRQ